MKRYLTCITILLLTAILPATACDSTPPVTDYDSFIENLQQAGATVEVTRQDTEACTFAVKYLLNYRDAFESVLESGRTIEPTYYERETGRLKEIEEQTQDFEVTYTDLTVNGHYVYANEYGSKADAQMDAEYAKLVDVSEFTVTIPTESENVTFIICSSRLGKPHYYRQDRIIALFLETHPGNPVSENSQAMMELLEGLLEPEFHNL